MLAGLLLLGARRGDRVSPGLGWILVGTSAWVATGLCLLLLLPGVDAADAPLFLGLPPRAAFLLLGVGVVPGLVLPLAYARVFDGETLSDDDLERLREASRRVAHEASEETTGRGPEPESSSSGGER